jgi:erythromycin esterase
MRPLHFARPLLLGFAFLLAACDSPSDGGGEVPIGWLRDNAVPFASVEPGGSFAELAPLGHMIGDVRIVGLGEATHGSREFFRMKHRIVEYLVRERGFRTFAIEATWAEATRVNRYLHTGEGDPAALLANLHFWTWNTREVLEMIQWMRAYNESVPAADRLSFYGIDVQHSRSAMDLAVSYLRSVDGAGADSAVAWYRCYRQFQDRLFAATPEYALTAVWEKEQCRAGVNAVHARIEQRADEYAARSGRAAYEAGLRSARVVVQNEDIRGGYPNSGPKRDTYMAENAAWIAEVGAPGSRVVLWAHNGHVGRLPAYMGTHLSQRFGDDYVVAGFSFFRGGFNAIEERSGLRAVQAPDAVRGSYEHEFNRLGLARFYVDLRPVRASGAPADAQWLRAPRPFRMIGATYREADPGEVYDERSLAQEFDIIIHLTDVTPTELITTRPE